MKLEAEASGQQYKIDLVRDGNSVTANIDGRPFEAEISEPERGVYLIKSNGRIVEAVVASPAEPSAPIQVTIAGRIFDVNVFDPKDLRGSARSDAHADGLAEVKTAMPGKVVKILAPGGSEVVKGQGVIVVEAMKMQNELRSPKDGIVRDIRVAEGATVAAGEVLATIE